MAVPDMMIFPRCDAAMVFLPLQTAIYTAVTAQDAAAWYKKYGKKYLSEPTTPKSNGLPLGFRSFRSIFFLDATAPTTA
jgi:hypothetical protein